jgi:hypothetical protein
MIPLLQRVPMQTTQTPLEHHNTLTGRAQMAAQAEERHDDRSDRSSEETHVG